MLRDSAHRVARAAERFAEHEASSIRGCANDLSKSARTIGGEDDWLAKTINHAGRADRELSRIEPNRRPLTAAPDLSSVPGVDELLRVPSLDNRWLREQLSGLEQQYGPYRLRLTDVSYFGPNGSGGHAVTGFRFNGEIIDGAGGRVGRLERHIYTERGGTVAFNAHMRLEPSARGRGFSRAFTAAINDYYRRSGVAQIKVFAVQDGSVAWARAGFDFDRDPEKLARTVSSIKDRAAAIYPDCSPADRKQLDRVLKQFKGGKARPPTAGELVELTGVDPELGIKLMKGASWHGVRMLSAEPGFPNT